MLKLLLIKMVKVNLKIQSGFTNCKKVEILREKMNLKREEIKKLLFVRGVKERSRNKKK